MRSPQVDDVVAEMRGELVSSLVSRHIPERAYAEQWDAQGLQDEVADVFGMSLPIVDWSKEEGIADEEMRERILDAVDRRAAERAAQYGIDVMRYVEKAILLQTLDTDWREHIIHLDQLRQFVGLRGYGQRDPLNEYKSEALALFEALLERLRTDVTKQLMHVQINVEQPTSLEPRNLPPMTARHDDPLTGENEMEQTDEQAAAGSTNPNDPRSWGKISRNAPCPCGSGKKFKYCHGALV